MTTLAIGLIYTIYDNSGEVIATVPMAFEIKNRSFVSQVYTKVSHMNCQHCGRKVTKLVVDSKGKCWGKDCYKVEFGIDLQESFDEATNIHNFSLTNESVWQIIESRKDNEKFFYSLYSQVCTYGKLSDKQIACVVKAGMPDKVEETSRQIAIWEKAIKTEKKASRQMGRLPNQDLIAKWECFIVELKNKL